MNKPLTIKEELAVQAATRSLRVTKGIEEEVDRLNEVVNPEPVKNTVDHRDLLNKLMSDDTEVVRGNTNTDILFGLFK